jgi:putative PIN family toxin of toxin-antitoxin system
MIRVVLDANVVVSGIITPEGTPGQILRAALESQFHLVLSSSILEEIERVLRYPHIAKRHAWPQEKIRLFIQELRNTAVLTPGDLVMDVITADPSDNKYLACALEGRADYIVSGDDHLLALRRFQDVIPILTPREFLAILPETEEEKESRL